MALAGCGSGNLHIGERMTEKIEPLTEDELIEQLRALGDDEETRARRIGHAAHWLARHVPDIITALSIERTARQKAEERVRELEDVISGCVLCSSPDTRWDEAMARYRAALTTDPPKEG
jgi:hypothetical protein